MASYSELLKLPSWQKRRLEILNRDNFTCQNFFCKHKGTGIEVEVQVHHIDYWSGKNPWEYPDELLITLCKDCHKLENVRNLAEGGVINCLKQVGFLYGDLSAFMAAMYADMEFRNSIISKIRRIQNG